MPWAGELFVRALKREGVRNIFTLSGGHIAPIYDACYSEGIQIIDVRHEQVAAHGADGWARVTGEPGVAVVTAGPGVTNSVSGVAEAFMAGSPMVVIAGRAPLKKFEMGALQDLDQVRLMEPITKWAKAVYEARRIPDYVRMAFRKARSGTPGPVYLECPIDILIQKVEEDKSVFLSESHPTPEEAYGDPASVRAAVELLTSAERPIIIAGDGLFWAKGDGELRELVELLEIPVRSIGFARGAVPEDHPLSFTLASMAEADVVLILGVKLDYSLGYGWPPVFGSKAKIIQVDVDRSRIGFNREAAIGIVGSPRRVLKQMIEEAKKGKKRFQNSAWLQQIRSLEKQAQEPTAEAYRAESLPIHPGRLAKEVVEFLDRDAIMIRDGADCTYWFTSILKARYMGQVIGTGAFGCLGAGTGFALAAKVARKERQVFLYYGDGTFGFNGMEFDTFVRHNLPILSVISNDSAWGMVKHMHRMWYGEDRIGGTVLKPGQRYEKVVEALGGYGEYITRIEEIQPALRRAAGSGRPACINVEVDPRPAHPVTMALDRHMGLLDLGK
jgi:acetolactate synthase-1/2/3 large subunit